MALTGFELFNYIRGESSQTFRDIVPSATKDNISTLSGILFNDSYQPQLNEFVNNLVNRIGLTIVRAKAFNNPLSLFKKGSVPLGVDIQEIYENPAEAQQYAATSSEAAKLLMLTNPDTHVAYHRMNRQDMYTKSIARQELQLAFVSWEKFEEYVQSIMTSLYSGNYIDEFKLTKALLDSAYDNDKIVQVEISAVTSEATAKAFLKKVRALHDQFKFPSSNYNAYSKFNEGKSVTTWSESDAIVLIVRADLLAELDVDALASVFNMDKAKFMGRVVTVDAFENDDLQAIICDEAFLQIHDNLLRFDEFYNARTMTWNYYLHAWNTFSLSPFANAVALVTDQSIPATSITTIGDVSMDISDAEGLDITYSPAGATTEVVDVVVEDETIVSAVIDSKNHIALASTTKEGTTTVAIKTDNGLIASFKVTVAEVEG